MKSFNEEWEQIHQSMEWGKYPSENVIRFVARNYYKRDRKHIRILDFGCGSGANTWFLAREGFDTYAFDGSKSAVEKAKAHLQAEGLSNVHFDVMDGTEILYENEFFDCVIDNVCIYANCLKYINEMYANVHRILKPGGKFFSTCFGTGTSGYGEGEQIEKNTFCNISKGALADRAVAHFFTKSELKTLAGGAGFSNIIIDEMTYTDNGISIEMFIMNAIK